MTWVLIVLLSTINPAAGTRGFSVEFRSRAGCEQAATMISQWMKHEGSGLAICVKQGDLE